RRPNPGVWSLGDAARKRHGNVRPPERVALAANHRRSYCRRHDWQTTLDAAGPDRAVWSLCAAVSRRPCAEPGHWVPQAIRPKPVCGLRVIKSDSVSGTASQTQGYPAVRALGGGLDQPPDEGLSVLSPPEAGND